MANIKIMNGIDFFIRVLNFQKVFLILEIVRYAALHFYQYRQWLEKLFFTNLFWEVLLFGFTLKSSMIYGEAARLMSPIKQTNKSVKVDFFTDE